MATKSSISKQIFEELLEEQKGQEILKWGELEEGQIYEILYIKTEFAKCVPVWGFFKWRIRHEYLLFWFPKFIVLCLNS